MRTVKGGASKEELNVLFFWSYVLLQGPPLAEGRLQALSVKPTLLHALDSGQSRTVIGQWVLMTSFSVCVCVWVVMVMVMKVVLLPPQTQTTAAKSSSARLRRISSTFTSTLSSRRFVCVFVLL